MMINLKESGFEELWNQFRAPAQAATKPKSGTTPVSTGIKNPVKMSGSGTASTTTASPTGGYQNYTDIFTGGPTTPEVSTGVKLPGEWTDASNFWKQMMETGNPTSSMAWRQQALPQAQQDIFQGIQQAGEQLGAGSLGKRYGTTMGRTSQDIATKRMNELNTTAMGMQYQSDEAARQRQMDAAQRRSGLGGDINQYGMNLDQMLYGMGTGMQGQTQNQGNQLGQYWQGNQWWSNPNINLIQGLSTNQLPYQYPQYEQGAGSQGMDIFSAILPFFLMGGL